MMRMLPVFAIALASAAIPLHAQLAPIQQYTTASKPAPVDDRAKASELRAAEDQFDRMTVPVSIAGYGPFRFLVDTGASRTAVSSDLASRLRLSGSDPVILHSVTGTSEIGTVNVPVLGVAAKTITNVQAAVLQSVNMGADGILGLDSLAAQSVLFDFKHDTLTIVPSSATAEDGSIIVTGRRRNGRLILTDARANNTRLTLVVDTGAEVSIGNPALYEKLKKGGKLEKSGTSELTSVTGATLSGDYTIVEKLEVGGVTLRNLPIVFADSNVFAQLDLGTKPALLLGMNALRGFQKVSIDFGRRRLWIVLPQESSSEQRAYAAL